LFVKPDFQAPREEHPFAGYVRILGKGKSGSRSLTSAEAEAAFTMILQGSVEPVQLGAFLMLLRVKEESAQELAGFVRACRTSIATPRQLSQADLDWSSYAGKKSQQAWYLLSALLLAKNGIRVLMHGADGHTPGRIYSEQILQHLGVGPAESLAAADENLQRYNFAWLPLRNFCRPLHTIMQYRHLLGLRSPVNTLARLLNPGGSKYSIQSVFHPTYAALHQAADALLSQPHSLVFKGEGGEVEIKPHAQTRCELQRNGQLEVITWPRSLPHKPQPEAVLSAQAVRQLWQHGDADSYGALAVIHTSAVALLLLERVAHSDQAIELARSWWQQRDRERCI
jgi:anthranilate phosphoribosyltransferase